MPAFISQALKGEDITIYGDGTQTRSFCYIDDLVEGIYRLLMSGVNEPVNLGNPHEMTILELTEKILDMTKSKSKIVFRSLPEDDPKIRQPDISKAKKHLDWEPKIKLQDGLKGTIEFFRTHR